MVTQLKSTLLLSVLILWTGVSLNAQGIGRSDRLVGKTHTVNNFGSDNQAFLRDADVALSQFDFEGALFALENAVAQNPYSALALVQRAKFRKMVGMEAEAREDIRMASLINPYAADLYGLNGIFGLQHILAYQPEAALEDQGITRRLALYPSLLEQWHADGIVEALEFELLEEILFELEQENLSDLLPLFDGLLTLYPESTIGHDLKGAVLMELKQFEAADASFSQAVQLEGPLYLATFLDRGLTRKIQGDFKGALADLNIALEAYPDNSELHKNRGNLNLLLGQDDQAVIDYSTAIELNPDYAEAYYNRGLAFILLYDNASACYDLQQSVDLGYEPAIEKRKYFCFE